MMWLIYLLLFVCLFFSALFVVVLWVGRIERVPDAVLSCVVQFRPCCQV